MRRIRLAIESLLCMKTFITHCFIYFLVFLFSHQLFAQKQQREVSIDGAAGIPGSFVFDGGLSFSGSVLFPVSERLKTGVNVRTDFFRWIPYFNYCSDCTERLWIYSLDARAKYILFNIDSFWSVQLNGEAGLTVIDPAKKHAYPERTFIYPAGNKYGYNVGGGIFLHYQFPRKMGFSLFVNYRITKILTEERYENDLPIAYDYEILYPGIEVTRLF